MNSYGSGLNSMGNIFRKIKNFYNADKLYLVFSLLKEKNGNQVPEMLRSFSQKRMLKKHELFEDTDFFMLDLKTPDRMNQCAHPDLVKLQDGSYLMAITPYPFGNDKYEQPVIFKSTNLKSWTYLSGPIDQERIGKKNHLSDPSILQMPSGRLYCYYRECLYDEAIPTTNIYRMDSESGIHWENKKCLITEAMDHFDVISPSFRWDESRGIHCYFCLKQNGQMKLMYSDRENIEKENLNEIILKDHIPEGKMLWHVSHICQEEKDVLLLTLSEGLGGENSELYVGEVSHLTFELSNLRKIKIKSQVSQIALEYRATGIVEANRYFIIDSVMFEDRTWGCIAFEER